jgi:phenylpyruvate tautomerase PptA (4-oxalocrotonate tautomerase family)
VKTTKLERVLCGGAFQKGVSAVPIVQISMNVDLIEQERQGLLFAVARLVSDVMAKPIEDVMVLFIEVDSVMGDSLGSAAFIDFRCLSGLQVDGVRERLCKDMLDILQQYVPIDSSRVYVNFFQVPPEYAWRFRDGVAVCPKSSVSVR